VDELLNCLSTHLFFWHHPSGVAEREEGEEPTFDSREDPQADVRRNVYYWLRTQVVEARIQSFYEMRTIIRNIEADDFRNHRKYLRLFRPPPLPSGLGEESANPRGVVAENVCPGAVNARPTPL